MENYLKWRKMVAVIYLLGVLTFAKRFLFAYLDPGTGSFIIQAIVAIILGGLLAIKMYWSRIARLVRGNKTVAAAESSRGRSNESSDD